MLDIDVDSSDMVPIKIIPTKMKLELNNFILVKIFIRQCVDGMKSKVIFLHMRVDSRVLNLNLTI